MRVTTFQQHEEQDSAKLKPLFFIHEEHVKTEKKVGAPHHIVKEEKKGEKHPVPSIIPSITSKKLLAMRAHS